MSTEIVDLEVGDDLVDDIDHTHDGRISTSKLRTEEDRRRGTVKIFSAEAELKKDDDLLGGSPTVADPAAGPQKKTLAQGELIIEKHARMKTKELDSVLEEHENQQKKPATTTTTTATAAGKDSGQDAKQATPSTASTKKKSGGCCVVL